MPPNRYDLVKDDHDVGAHPLYPDQAFEIGITFQAKLIGWQDVSRPTNQTEIVHAMRRIRYEGKIQNIKKKKVTIEISVDGLKVCLKRKKQKKKDFNDMPNEIVLMNHPIYRIFYVSHDSSDLKIFSYIARDGSTDNFTCSVFKSSKKSQAMKIVRTVGQAFEVCHKKSVEKIDEQSLATDDNISEDNDLDSNFKDDDLKKEIADEILNAADEKENRYQNGSNNSSSNNKTKNNKNNNGNVHTLKLSPIITDSINRDSMKNSNSNNSYNHRNSNDNTPSTPLSPNKETQRLRDLLEQQTMQTQHALEQLIIVRNQLMAETNARIEAQVKVQQLIQQNRELLEHITTVGNYHDSDKLVTGTPLSMQPQSPLPMYLPYDQNLGAKLQNQKWNHPPQYGLKYNQDLYSINQEILNQLQNINMNHNGGGGGFNTISPTILGKMQISPYLSPMQNHSLASSYNSNISGSNSINNKFNENHSIINDNCNVINHNSNNNSSHDIINNSDIATSMSSIISKHAPSPMDMLHMNHSYSNSIDGINFDSSDDSLFIKPLSQVGTLTTLDSDGKIKVVVPITKPNCINSLTQDTPVQRRKEKKVTLPEIVTFRVTDEKGNVINTNTKKLPATPSGITRSTSEKVPNRSQVQRTTWARHTTK